MKTQPDGDVRVGLSRAGLGLVCLAALSGSAGENEGIFSADALHSSAIEIANPTPQRRLVRIDFARLDAARDDVMARRPARLLLNLFDGVVFSAVVERTAPTSSGYSLSGRLEGIPFGTVALVRNRNVVLGKVRTPLAVYTIKTLGADTHVIERSDPETFREHPPLTPDVPAAPQESRAGPADAEADDGSTIDVFVFWTRTARRDAGGSRHIQTAIDLAVAETNDAYAASGASQRIELVGAVEVNYEETGRLTVDLERLVDPADGFMDEVHAIRDSYAADLVHFTPSGICGGGGVEGLANAMTEPSPGFASFAFAASVFCNQANLLGGIAHPGLGSSLFAHELGHNMGLQHDRYARYTTLNKPFPYSHGYVNQAAFENRAGPSTRWRTIMSYDDQCRDAGFSCRRLLRFSNPDQRFPDAQGHRLGVPGDAPSEAADGPADAVRSLDETRRVVANFRPSSSRCTYRLDRETVTVPATGGAVTINVDTSEDCAYTARSHDEFVSAMPGRRKGVGAAQFQVAINDGGARVGAVSVAGETVVVRQSGVLVVAGVCDRTPPIRDAIMAWAGKVRCGDVTDFDLAEIPYLLLPGRGMRTLQTDDLSGLSRLRTLDLSYNDIGGALPPELGELRNLEVLVAHDNQFTGTVPPELGQLANLRLLDLSHNELEGALPERLSQLAQLRHMRLRGNRLTGTIPPWLGDMGLYAIDLKDNQMTGPIPVELGRLKDLAALQFAGNDLTGPIPAELGKIENLQNVDLSGNRLTGTIPVELADLQRLGTLYLHGNRLAGSIPRALGGLPRLQSLRLRDNELTGTVPAELTDLAALQWLELADNPLGGCIPGALRGVRKHDLDQLGLGYCAAVSFAAGGGPPSAPAEVGRVAEGRAATLAIAAEPAQDSPFEVTVAVSGGEAFGVAQGDRKLTIARGMTSATLVVETTDDHDEEPDGAFTATILAGADYAVFVSRSSASITLDDDEGPAAPTIVALKPDDGTLSVAWTAPDDGGAPITGYDIRHRPTTSAAQNWTLDSAGPRELQRDITGLANRVEYAVQVRAVNEGGDGAWSDAAKATPKACPDRIELGECRTLLAARDSLVGDGTPLNWDVGLPIREWTGISVRAATGRVIQLNLIRENLRGTISGTLGSLAELRNLLLNDNALTGAIPAQLGNLVNLENLWLDRNRLTGSIPEELGDLSNLRTLYMMSNRLTGSIPPSLGRLSNLKGLYISHNRLTGALPASLGGLVNLQVAWLHGNELTGPIPAEIGRLQSLVALLLDRNRLTGAIPPELGNLAKLEALHLSHNQLTGAIPRTLGKLKNLDTLYLAGNELSGCVPSALRSVAKNDLHSLDLPDCPPAAVSQVRIVSTPEDGTAYGKGEQIEASIWFETDVTVSGSPRLAFAIGSETREATFQANRGDGQLVFNYEVKADDLDADGISIAADALSLNGGEIRDADGKNATIGLGAHAFTDDPTHKVRGALRQLAPVVALDEGGEGVAFDLAAYFEAPEGGALTYGSPRSSDTAIVTAVLEGGLLTIIPHGTGTATITVTATDTNGVTLTLTFEVTVEALRRSLRPWLIAILSEERVTHESGQ